MKAALLAAALLLAVFPLEASGASGGSILGRVYTAEHEDSVGRGAAVELIYRDSAGERQEIRRSTGEDGHFHFSDLSTDSALVYVLRISLRGRAFLSDPIRFAVGETEIDYNVLLSDADPDFGDLPAGHPPMPGAPATGRPVAQSPAHTVLIVLWTVLLFALFALLARRNESQAREGDDPAARALARDIAGLDRRRADGVIGDEEYRKVRAVLVEQLRARTGGVKR